MQNVMFKVWRRIVACFLVGLLAVLPLVLTIAIVVWVTGFVQSFVGPGSFLGRSLEFLGLKKKIVTRTKAQPIAYATIRSEANLSPKNSDGDQIRDRHRSASRPAQDHQEQCHSGYRHER